MKGFSGFADGKLKTLPLPEPFFTELLPQIDHLGELKITLYAFWRLNLKTGNYRFLLREDFAADELLMRGLSPSPRHAEEALDDALERAAARGTLLQVVIEDAQVEHHLYFMNTAKGREAVEKLTRGEWRPETFEGQIITLSRLRSNIYTLYEQNIGALTPMIADELRDLAATYSPAWIEDAIRIAVKNNVRRLKYILAILERMKTEGRYDTETDQDPPAALRGYEGYLPFTGGDEGAPDSGGAPPPPADS
jgi:DnaD/phage-associated family protein